MWWDFYHRRDPSVFRVPVPGHTPHVTSGYIKWWNARTGFYRACKLDCWDSAERKILRLQLASALDIDKDHLLRLMSQDQTVVGQYLDARLSAKKKKTTPELVIPEVKADNFLTTLEHLSNISIEQLTLAQPWPIEEDHPTALLSSSKVDAAFPCRTFLSLAERSATYYQFTSWLFVFLGLHNLTIESDHEMILDHRLHAAFHYADGWGMDHLGLYYFLSSVGYGDLAVLVEDCQKINDACWLVKEAASRNGQSAFMYWPLSHFYKGPADRSAKDRRKRYHELLLKVSKPAVFEERVVRSPLAIRKPPATRSAITAAVVEAKRASKRKKSMPSHIQASVDAPVVPSFEEFVEQHDSRAPASDIPLPKACLPPECEIPRCLPIPDITNAPSSPCAKEVSAEAVAFEPVGEEIPPTLPVAITPSIASRTSKRLAVKTRKRAKEPSGFHCISSRASGSLALMKIRQGNQTLPPDTFSDPVAISSGSSSSAGDVCSSSPSGIAAKDSPKGSFKERMSALEGIEEDSASSVDVSPAAYHEPVTLAAPKIAPEFSPERHDSAPNLLPAVGVGSGLALAIVLYVPPLATAQDIAAEPELPLDDATDISLEALAPQASSAPVDTVAVASSLTVSDTTLVETNVGPSATSTAIGIGLPSCSHEVDTSLWAAIDDQVNFPAPPSESAGGVSFSDSMVKRQLSALSSIVTQGPCPSYEQLKPIVEKLTEVLVLLGCPLTEWAKRVTLLLKYVKRQQFLLNELPDQLVALEL
ncbi:hypothetical protein Taro_015068 [Colocasia esculenta]|uniref:Uncharacterized protein n=1 Tax=Colocasia esculenta TaxID=4460 RepID=A0A843UGF3_COLES|nr:hypothetical protein [Colocasia esculenta]